MIIFILLVKKKTPLKMFNTEFKVVQLQLKRKSAIFEFDSTDTCPKSILCFLLR